MSETFAGRYRLEQQLGAGSMAEVWLAIDTQLGRPVALKLLRADADPERFEREARAVASLSHPNICRLYDYGSEGGRPFMVFEHLPGGTLEERLGEGGPLPDSETGTIAAEVAAGLAHAHEHGLIHRDLKPANILFDEEGRAKVSDFGIARMSGMDTLTEAGTLIGTAAYMSPEQASGEGATPASDVYSFGVILYRMLDGAAPVRDAEPRRPASPPAVRGAARDPLAPAGCADDAGCSGRGVAGQVARGSAPGRACARRAALGSDRSSRRGRGHAGHPAASVGPATAGCSPR